MGFGSWNVEYGSWIIDCRSLIMEYGSWIVGLGFWIMDCGLWIMDSESGVLDHGSYTLESGSWIMDHGFWIILIDCGIWIMDCRSWVVDHGLLIIDCGSLEVKKCQKCYRLHISLLHTVELFVHVQNQHSGAWHLPICYPCGNKSIQQQVIEKTHPSYFYLNPCFCIFLSVLDLATFYRWYKGPGRQRILASYPCTTKSCIKIRIKLLIYKTYTWYHI